MADKLYFLHHAPAPRKPFEIIGSQVDRDIDSYGIKIAHILAARIKIMIRKQELENLSPLIFTSSLKRAISTARIIAAENNLKVCISNQLNARNFGIFEGKTIDEIKVDPDLNSYLWENVPMEKRFDYHPPYAESNRAFLTRVNLCKNNLLETNNSNPLIITHGSFIDGLLCIQFNESLEHIDGQNRKYEGRVLQVSNNQITPLGFHGEQFSHLPGIDIYDTPERIAHKVKLFLEQSDIYYEEKEHLQKMLVFFEKQGNLLELR